jgi:DNA-directed RNA polymerase subunit beta
LETTPENRALEGLYRVFQENFPITDARNIFNLEFLDYFVDPPRYTIPECMQRGLTYSVPLKAKLRLSCNDEEHVDFKTIVQDVFLGNIPYMTPKGTFVINGAERVIVSQLHRLPGYSSVKASTLTVRQDLLRPGNSFQRRLDGVCHRHQYGDVRLHRP